MGNRNGCRYDRFTSETGLLSLFIVFSGHELTPNLSLFLSLFFIQVTGLVHDLGKLLHFFGSEGQWDVVGVSISFLGPFLVPSAFSVRCYSCS